ncbi:MAG: pseudouridine synthase, partial [Bacteroidota bacterium]
MDKKRRPSRNFKQNKRSNQVHRLRSEKEVIESKANTTSVEGMRLNKYVAHCGICSRRQAAEEVKAGRVSVNDQVEINPAYQVQIGDEIKYKGKLIKPEEKLVYLLLNKPKNVITTLSDEKGRKTVIDLVADKITERIFPVGRLDRATTGLLILTNDGDLAQRLAHPRHQVKKVYHVVLDKEVSDEDIAKIAAGLELEDGSAPVDGVSHVEGKSKHEVG